MEDRVSSFHPDGKRWASSDVRNPSDNRAAERRQWPRLNLKLNVQFAAEAPQEEGVDGTGTTANVSAGGLYFNTANWKGLEPGQNLQLHLSGLSGYDAGPLFRSLRGKATVLRLDIPGNEETAYSRVGVAVRFDERPRVDVYSLSA
jgi:hypothetical protein